MTNKLLIVGWDGATFDIIRPMIEQGELPHLARLMAEGGHGDLRSTIPYHSAAAWTTCTTGRDPAGHGVFDFNRLEGHSYQPRLVSSRDVQVPRLWDWLAQAGYRVGVINVPVTYPPQPVNGFLVSGMLTPGPWVTFTYPAQLSERLLAGPRPYPIEMQVLKQALALANQSQISAGLETLQRWSDDFHAAVCDLAGEQPWDCLVVVYRITDEVQHGLGFLWRPDLVARTPDLAAEARGGIQSVYRQVDAALGDLLALAPPETTVLVVSDHGFGPCHGRFHVNSWLRQGGYLALQRGARLRFRRVPLHRVLTRLGLGGFARRLPPRLAHLPIPRPESRPWLHRVDWRRTRAYQPSPLLGVRLNLAGREPQGIVQPGVEAQARLDELAHHLMAARDDQRHPVFQEVLFAPDGAAGRPDNWGWDLMPLPHDDPFYWPWSDVTDDGRLVAEVPIYHVGQHRPEGILVARGPAIAPGTVISGVQIADITPTALHLMGLPVPAEMEGRVIVDMLRPDWLTAHAVQRTTASLDTRQPEWLDAYTPGEKDQVEGALRALGYVD